MFSVSLFYNTITAELGCEQAPGDDGKKFVQSVAGSTNTEVKVTRAILQKETTFKFTKNEGMQMAQTQNSLPDC